MQLVNMAQNRHVQSDPYYAELLENCENAHITAQRILDYAY